MTNIAVMVGRLTRDVNFSVSQSNVAIANGTIAVNRPFKNSEGNYEADFINFVAFRQKAETINNYLKKGSQVSFTGRMQSRKYQDKSENTVFVTELVVENVQFLEPKGSNQAADGNQSNSHTNAYGGNSNATKGAVEPNPFENSNGAADINDDDLPF